MRLDLTVSPAPSLIQHTNPTFGISQAMPDPSILQILTAVSSVLGLLATLAYFFLLILLRHEKTSVKDAIEGEGLFNANLVVKLLAQFSTDDARLKALETIAGVDERKAARLLGKIKANVDLGRLRRLSIGGQTRLLGISALFLLALAALSLVATKQGKVPEPSSPPPSSGSAQTASPTAAPSAGATTAPMPASRPASPLERPKPKRLVVPGPRLDLTPATSVHQLTPTPELPNPYHLSFKAVRGNYTKMKSLSIEPYLISTSTIPGQAVIEYAERHAFSSTLPSPTDTVLHLHWAEAAGIAKLQGAELPSRAQWINAYKQGAFVPQSLELVQDTKEGVLDLCDVQVRPGHGNTYLDDDVFSTCFHMVSTGPPPTGALRLVRPVPSN